MPMAHLGEPSFTSSSYVSNGSTNHNIPYLGSEAVPGLDVVGLSKLSINLEQLLLDPSGGFSDAYVVVEGVPVSVHRCVLAARSKFFQDLFNKEKKGCLDKDGKPKYTLSDFLPYGSIGCEALLVILSYLYTGKLKPSPPEVSTCADDVCAHDSCRPAIHFTVELMYASSIFQIPELVSIYQRRLLNFVGKALVDNVIPILLVAFHCQSSELLNQCTDRVGRSDLDNIFLEKEIPREVAKTIKDLRLPANTVDGQNKEAIDPSHERRIKRIHRALDSDDVELVKLLLSESHVTLDEANALHYASAYCDPKIVSEVLGLGLADVNLRNPRGYTVLHIAAMRKEPSVIVSLLSKGACASELTLDGQSAVSICRRLTRPKDYHTKTEQGQEANKDKLCIDVLEREMRRNPLAGNAEIPTETVRDDLRMKLLYLENRVAFARLIFPTEAKLAMDIAHAETSDFASLARSKGSKGNLRAVDLNETPIAQNKRLLSRIGTLMKIVEMGQRYFPHCSEVLDKFMDDDLQDLFYLDKGTPDEQRNKRTRFTELKEDVEKAFNKDKAGFSSNGMSPSSSSSSSLKDGVDKKQRKQ